MPYAVHLRVTLSGDLGPAGAPVEEFATRFCIGRPGNQAGMESGPGYCDDVASDVVDWWAGGQPFSAASHLTSAKFAVIGSDGKYLGDPYVVALDARGLGNGQGPNPQSLLYPPQIALAITLDTPINTRSTRGRMFLPGPISSIRDDALLISTQADGIAAAAATFIRAVNNRPGIDGGDQGVCIASGKGYNTLVTSVRCGRALDTVRSRRAQLDERYTAPAVV